MSDKCKLKMVESVLRLRELFNEIKNISTQYDEVLEEVPDILQEPTQQQSPFQQNETETEMSVRRAA